MQGYDYFTHDDLEKVAENQLLCYCAKYDKSILDEPQQLDIEHFAEIHGKLTIDYKNLSNDNSILGCTAFNDGKLEVWDDDRANRKVISVKKRTILLDTELANEENKERARFTISHECAHQILHKKYYQNSSLCTANYIEGEYTREQNRHEWQANYLGSCLLMPKNMVFHSLLHWTGFDKVGLTIDYLLQNFRIEKKYIEKLAEVFGVSKTAMKIRLKNLKAKV